MNEQALKNDIARGGGEYLEAFIKTYQLDLASAERLKNNLRVARTEVLKLQNPWDLEAKLLELASIQNTQL